MFSALPRMSSVLLQMWLVLPRMSSDVASNVLSVASNLLSVFECTLWPVLGVFPCSWMCFGMFTSGLSKSQASELKITRDHSLCLHSFLEWWSSFPYWNRSFSSHFLRAVSWYSRLRTLAPVTKLVAFSKCCWTLFQITDPFTALALQWICILRSRDFSVSIWMALYCRMDRPSPCLLEWVVIIQVSQKMSPQQATLAGTWGIS